jgi:hypothetical protein
MKRLAIAGVLALGLLACSQQRASAWCKLNISAGFNISYESSGFCFSSCFNCYSPPCPYGGAGFSGFGGGYPAYGYDGLAAYPAYAPAATAAPASTFTAPKPTPASGAAAPGATSYAGTQPVNYSYYGQGGYNYGYGGYGPAAFQAPSYWYDR